MPINDSVLCMDLNDGTTNPLLWRGGLALAESGRVLLHSRIPLPIQPTTPISVNDTKGPTMTILDRILLLSAALVAARFIQLHWSVLKQTDGGEKFNIYHLIAFATLAASTLLLGVFGWGILGFMGDGTENKMVAVVASAIPFAWATGMVAHSYPKQQKWYLVLMIVAFLLITLTRFMEMKTLGRVIYPVSHSTAGLTVIVLPIIAVVRRNMPPSFLLVSLGGFLISVGGISMAFIIAGRQLLFVSADVLFLILAPVLLATVLLYAMGLAGGWQRALITKTDPN